MERRKFTREFKLEAVQLIQERGVTVAQATRDLGVHGTDLPGPIRPRMTVRLDRNPGRSCGSTGLPQWAQACWLRHDWAVFL